MSFGNFEKFEERIPTGVCKVVISKAEDKPTATEGQGRVLHLTLTVVEGEFKNESLRAFVTHTHVSPQAQNIGRRNLNNIAKSLGYDGIEDLKSLDDIAGKTLTVELKAGEDRGYGVNSEVKDWNPKPKTAINDEVPF